MFIRNSFLFAPEGGESAPTLLGGGGNPDPTPSPTPQPHHQDDGDKSASFDFRSALDEKGNFKPGWTANVPADLKEYADHFGKFPSPLEILRSNANAQKLIGQKSTFKVPGEGAKPEEVSAFRKAIGVPDTPDGYGLKAPEKLPEGVTIKDEDLKDFAKFAHENNLTPAQANKLIEYDLAQKAQMAQTGQANLKAFVDKQAAELKTKWGDKMPQNIEVAKKTASLLGIDPNDPELGNSAKMIEALYNASKLFSEDKLVGADKAGSGMTGAQQAEDIRRNVNNPWHAAYHGKEGPERQREAADLLMRLSGVKVS